jgi:hypothetical protein
MVHKEAIRDSKVITPPAFKACGWRIRKSCGLVGLRIRRQIYEFATYRKKPTRTRAILPGSTRHALRGYRRLVAATALLPQVPPEKTAASCNPEKVAISHGGELHYWGVLSIGSLESTFIASPINLGIFVLFAKKQTSWFTS